MPYARVSVLPQPSGGGEDGQFVSRVKGGNSSSSNTHPVVRGITIQDLKKQTAQRLAQEQQRKVSKSRSNTHTLATANPSSNSTGSSGSSHRGGNGTNGGASGVRGRRNNNSSRNNNKISSDQNIKMNVSDHDDNHRMNRRHCHSDHKPVPSVVLTDQMIQRNLVASANTGDSASVASIGSASFHSIGTQQQQQYSYHSPSTAASRSPAPNSNGGCWRNSNSRGASPSSSSGYRNHSASYPKKNMNKLPHGLTVHELKEMTKARLAAEAAASQRNQHDQQRQIATPPASSQWTTSSMQHSPQPPTTPVSMMSGSNSLYGIGTQHNVHPMSPSNQRTPLTNRSTYPSPWKTNGLGNDDVPTDVSDLRTIQSSNSFQQPSFFGYNSSVSASVPTSPKDPFMTQQRQAIKHVLMGSQTLPSFSETPPPPPLPNVAAAPSSAPAKSFLQRESSLGNHMPEWVAESVLFSPAVNEFLRKTSSSDNGSITELSTMNDFYSTKSHQSNEFGEESAFSGVFRDTGDANGGFGSAFGGSLSFGCIGDNLSRGSTPRPRIGSVGSVGLSSDFNALLRVNEGEEHREIDDGSVHNENSLFGFLSSSASAVSNSPFVMEGNQNERTSFSLE